VNEYNKHRKVLNSIFGEPVRSNIIWNDIEKLLMALGAEISEGSGSRVRLYLNGVKAVFHRPHPKNETDKGALKSKEEVLRKLNKLFANLLMIILAFAKSVVNNPINLFLENLY